jgi:hypothetical protein
MTRSYTDLTLSLGLMPCGACDDLSIAIHAGGRTTGTTIHFLDKNINRADNRRFLKLAAFGLDPTLTDPREPLWRHIYRTSVAMRGVARTLHIRIPRSDMSLSRAVVLAGVAGLTNEVPLRKQAFDWARR